MPRKKAVSTLQLEYVAALEDKLALLTKEIETLRGKPQKKAVRKKAVPKTTKPAKKVVKKGSRKKSSGSDESYVATCKTKEVVGSRYGKTTQMQIGNFKNTFKDDGKSDRSKTDKKFRIPRTTERRPPVKNTKVDVVCNICGKTEKVKQSEAPVKVGDAVAFYRCAKCCKGR